MTSLPSDRPTVRTLVHVSQCEMRHSNPVLQPGFFSAGNCMANCAAVCVCLAGSCNANCVKKKTKNDFEDDKIQSQFMWPTAGERARRLVAGETNRLTHHQNVEVKSFYSDTARRNVAFLLLEWNVSLTQRCKPNRKIRNRIKGLVILRRGEYIHVILLTKLCCLARYFFSCSVDTATCLTSEQPFELIFQSMFVISLGVLYSNLVPFCFI